MWDHVPAMKGGRMQAYSQDLRDRVLRALERGEGPTEIARRFEVSRLWVYQVRERMQKTGERCSFPIGGHRKSRFAEAEPLLRAWIAEQPDLTFKKNSARQRARARGRASGATRLGGSTARHGHRKTGISR